MDIRAAARELGRPALDTRPGYPPWIPALDIRAARPGYQGFALEYQGDPPSISRRLAVDIRVTVLATIHPGNRATRTGNPAYQGDAPWRPGGSALDYQGDPHCISGQLALEIGRPALDTLDSRATRPGDQGDLPWNIRASCPGFSGNYKNFLAPVRIDGT